VRLVLASRSPQRRAILEQLGVEFAVRHADVEELERGDGEAVARENAQRKAIAAAPAPGEVVLAVDTIVTLDGRIYGKPRSDAEALQTLAALSGRTHQVISGLVLLEAGRAPLVNSATTAVSFRELDRHLMEWYVATGEWRERSGGYAVQRAGGALIRRLDGDYNNVVGLPLALLLDVWPSLLSASPQPPSALHEPS
jgi:septum formation protein